MLNIRRITIGECREVDVISELAATIWRQHFITIISQEQIEYMLKKYQSKEAIRRQLSREGYVYYLAYEGTEPVAYMGVVPKPNEGEVFLSKLYVKKTFRRRGIAGALISEIGKDYPKESFQRIYLTCNKNNEDSIQAYLKMGFSITDSIVTPIGNDMVMDDYVLTMVQ